MQRFVTPKNTSHFKWIIIGVLFLVFYAYFFVFNKFHLFYLEQTQLFRFSGDYFRSFLSKPGDLIFYFGEFLSQFFISPSIGALIITGLAAVVFFISSLINKRIGISTLVSDFFPVLLIAALQSNHLYKVGLTVGIIFALSFTYGYTLLKNSSVRYIGGGLGLVVLYLLSGGFALLAALLALLLEMVYFKSEVKWINISVLAIVSLGFPFLAWKFFYLETFSEAWFYPFPFWGVLRTPLFGVLLIYFPLIIIAFSCYRQIRKKEKLVVAWNYKTALAGAAIVISGLVLIKAKAYDPKIETFLGMDYYVQTGDWNKVIGLSKEYPGTNQLVTYYTNLALYKTDQMADRMFSFSQHGAGGLQLEWKRDEVTPFFGGEVFYHLNYINEAYRWAFESMVAKGLNPRSLKRLVLTSLINGHYQIASKYLNILDQTMFYKGWAKEYKAYVSDTSRINQNPELAAKRKYLVKQDFISYSLGLNDLLREHPNNRMAFEYQMAAFLLNKDIKGFADNIYRVKELGYRQIPVSYEEALLFCMTFFKKDLVPAGFSIRPETIQRKNEYIASISRCGGNRDLAKRELFKQFGKTCWYYLHFVD